MRGSRTGSFGEGANLPQKDVALALAPTQSDYGKRMAAAIKITSNLKMRLKDNPELLASLTSVLHSVIAKRVEVREARNRIHELLSYVSYADLLAEMLRFLPIPEEQKQDEDEREPGNDFEGDEYEYAGEGGVDFLPSSSPRSKAAATETVSGRRYKWKRPLSEYELENLRKGVKRLLQSSPFHACRLSIRLQLLRM